MEVGNLTVLNEYFVKRIRTTATSSTTSTGARTAATTYGNRITPTTATRSKKELEKVLIEKRNEPIQSTS